MQVGPVVCIRVYIEKEVVVWLYASGTKLWLYASGTKLHCVPWMLLIVAALNPKILNVSLHEWHQNMVESSLFVLIFEIHKDFSYIVIMSIDLACFYSSVNQ